MFIVRTKPLTINSELAHKLLEMAIHPGTSIYEARNAVRMLYGKLSAAGLSLEDEYRSSAGANGVQSSASSRDDQQKIIDENARLKQENELLHAYAAKFSDMYNRIQAFHTRADSERQRLELENIELAERVRVLESATSSDTGQRYGTYAAAAAVAARVFGTDRCKPAWAAALGMPLKVLNGWEAAGAFPTHLIDKLSRLSPEQVKPASRKPWTLADLECLKAVLATGASDFEAAQILSVELGRRLFEPSITRQRRRLFRTEGWKPERKARGSCDQAAAAPASARTSDPDASSFYARSGEHPRAASVQAAALS